MVEYFGEQLDGFLCTTHGWVQSFGSRYVKPPIIYADIIAAIADLDADVITIEASRSNMELLNAFIDYVYPNDIGPGVYDIHSPNIRCETLETMR